LAEIGVLVDEEIPHGLRTPASLNAALRIQRPFLKILGSGMDDHHREEELLARVQSWSLDRRNLLKSAASLASLAGLKGIDAALAGIVHETPNQRRNVIDMTHSQKSVTQPWLSRQIGFQLADEQFTVPELVELGVAAEDAGFDLLAFSDHFQPWQENEGHAGFAWITMAAIGQRTKRIRMGTTVTCPTFRYNPGVVAEAFASLSLLYPDRIFLGVGSGEALNEEAAVGSWPKWPERSERLVEATEIIRKLWGGGQIEHSGKNYKLNARLYDLPSRPIPLMMAGNGPKAMRRCGQYADGLITDPKTWKQHKTEFQKGATDSGKDPKRMPVFIEQYVVVGDQKTTAEAAERWRFGPKAWKPYFNVRDPKTIQKRAEAEVPLEKVTEGWPVGTDPDAHVTVLTDLFESGATEVHIHSGQRDQKKVIEFYGKEVLPRLRRTTPTAAA
jgi:F420-dependent hydroxymycolic acid dehydrogenase